MQGASWRNIKLWRPDICRQYRRGLWTLHTCRRANGNLWAGWPPSRISSNSRHAHDTSRHVTAELSAARGSGQDQELHAILSRAPHGINSFARLEFESDVNHLRDQGSKLTDLPVNRQDLDLWLVLLEYRLLKYGPSGIQDILYGMRFRGKPVKLLEYDDASDRIWDLSLGAASDHVSVLQALCDSNEGIGRDRPTLFLDVVGTLLKGGKVSQAQSAATIMWATKFRGRQDLVQLFDLVVNNTASVTLDDFCSIYDRLPFFGFYADAVPALSKAGRTEEAFRMHNFLLKHHDYPKTFEHIEALIRDLAHRNVPLEPFLSELEAAGLFFNAQSRKFYAQVKAFERGASFEAIDLSSTIVRQRRLNDQFVARVFATHTLSFEFALKSLKFFGLVEVGPLAVRELGTSAGSLEELRARFRMLEDMEVDTGSSVFVTVVKNLCEANAAPLLRAVLTSDLHHDVFEDYETQKRLLSEYLNKRDWPQVNRTLAILNRGRTDPAAQRTAQHLLLRSAIVIRDWRGALIRLADIGRQAHGGAFDSDRDTVGIMLDPVVDMILAKGKRFLSTDKDYLDRIRYLTGVLQNMEFCGIPVSPKLWQKVLLRWGSLYRFGKVEGLTLWLAFFLRKRSDRLGSNKSRGKLSDAPDQLTTLFDAEFQAAVLQWTVCRQPFEPRNSGATDAQKQGARLLSMLLKKYGVPMKREEARELFKSRTGEFSSSNAVLDQYLSLFDEVWASEIDRDEQSNVDQHMYSSPFFSKATSMP